MSRLGKKPIPVPANVKVAVNGRSVQIEGPKGKLQWEHRREVAVKFDDAKKQIVVERMNDERLARAFREHFGLKPREIIDALDLRKPIYMRTAAFGHFGRSDAGFTWERTDKAEALRKAVRA